MGGSGSLPAYRQGKYIETETYAKYAPSVCLLQTRPKNDLSIDVGSNLLGLPEGLLAVTVSDKEDRQLTEEEKNYRCQILSTSAEQFLNRLEESRSLDSKLNDLKNISLTNKTVENSKQLSDIQFEITKNKKQVDMMDSIFWNAAIKANIDFPGYGKKYIH